MEFMQAYKILEHTGDVKMKVYGRTEEELFENAMRGMFAIVHATCNMKNEKVRTIKLQSSDINALLVDFLSEVNYLRLVNREAYDKIKFAEFSDTQLQGELRGWEVEEFGEDIKAVTFHELDIHQNSQGNWETALVFDV